MKMKIKIENETYEVEIDDLESRPILATVNGETFEVFPEETQVVKSVVSTPAPVKSAAPTPVRATPKPAAPAVSAGSKSVVAPIPGVIDSIKVREGVEVKNGQELLILEAMKMKNAIRATRDGKIERIYVSVGDQVPHNHVLLDFAD
jgi:biotin carboxyl carrier protein